MLCALEIFESLLSNNEYIKNLNDDMVSELKETYMTRPKFARQTKHQVFFSFRNIALHFIINEMLAG